MTNKFERQLQALIENDVDKALDGIPEEGETPEEVELLPVVFDEKSTALQAVDGNPDLLEDYRFARSNLYGLVGRTNAAIELVLRIAAMSEHPRAIEVAANLLKTSADITKDLIELQKSLEKKTQGKQPESGIATMNQQNNYYYGSQEKPKDAIEQELDDLDDNS